MTLAVHRIVPGEEGKPKKSKNEEAGKNEDAINQTFFRGQVHENGRNETRFEESDEERDSDVGFSPTRLRHVDVEQVGEQNSKIHVGKPDSNKSK